jgi:hypothetical protein
LKLGVLFTLAALLAGPSAPRSRVFVLHPASSVKLVVPAGRLAADGKRAAAAGSCFVQLWKVGARKPTLPGGCRGRAGIDFEGVDEIALAGDRLAWMRQESISHGTRVQTELVVKDGAAPARAIASAYNDSGFGAYLLTLAGDDGTLAFGWDYSFDEDFDLRAYRIGRTNDADPCPFEPDGLLPNRLTQYCVDTGVHGLVRAVSGSRILVSFGDLLGIVEADNSEHDLPVPFTLGEDAVALSGSTLVVLRAGSAGLRVYDVESGSLEHEWRVPKLVRPSRLTVGGGFAVYASKGVHLVRLSDGRHVKLQIPRGKRPVAATLEQAGLFVLYRVGRRERLGFVPRAQLVRAG